MQGIGCRTCSGCDTKEQCKPFRGKLRNYTGIRFTADGFDCALPVAIDSHSTCSYRCLYCFSNFLMRDPIRKTTYCQSDSPYKAGQWSLRCLEQILNGQAQGKNSLYYQAITNVSGDKRKCPIQWGALGDPFDNIERQQGWSLEAMKVFEKHEQPVRISTKGAAVLLEPEYQKAFNRRPELYWVAWSCISIDDDILSQIDKDAPPAQLRLKAMKSLAKKGVKNSLRMRPILPGVSDRTPRHKHAWRDLVRAARDAGAISISLEFAFVPGIPPKHVKKMWNEIERVVQIPITKHYKETTTTFGACLRSSRAWKEDLPLAIYEETKKLGYNFGISDPHWKELNDYGSCCGIPHDDPIFGGWQRHNATNAVVRARRAHDQGKRLLVSAKDGIPDWAKHIRRDGLGAMAGRQTTLKRTRMTWADYLRDTWNNLKSPRGPLQYFEGILQPVRRAANGDVLYEYRPAKRRDKSLEVPYLHV